MPELLPRRAGEDGLRRVQGPARASRPARYEETRRQHQHGQQIDPVTQHVHIGEHHVAGADHQRDEVVAEAPEKQRREQVDDHDHAVHGDKLQVGLRLDKGEGVRKAELQPHQPRQHQGYQANGGRRESILDGDDLGVLAPDIFRDEAMRVVKLYVLDFGRSDIVDGVGGYIGHQNTSPNWLPGHCWAVHHRPGTHSTKLVWLAFMVRLNLSAVPSPANDCLKVACPCNQA